MNNLMDLGGGVSWLGILIIGGLAGWIAEKLTKSEMGLFMNIVTGIVGAFIGRILANAVGIQVDEIFQGRWFLGNLIVSVIGAVILIIVLRLVRSRAA